MIVFPNADKTQHDGPITVASLMDVLTKKKEFDIMPNVELDNKDIYDTILLSIGINNVNSIIRILDYNIKKGLGDSPITYSHFLNILNFARNGQQKKTKETI